jgi:DNA-binding MarR family transcriptional regulator
MEFEKNRSAGYLVNLLARKFARGLAARLAPLGLTIGTFPALLELWDEDGLTQKDLVMRLDIEQATMANTLARMERDGLVIRKKDASDGRAQRIWLTDRARSLRAAAVGAAGVENAVRLAGLSKAEIDQFLDLIWRMIRTEEDQSGAAPVSEGRIEPPG